jgi:hypothetical protein
MPNPIDPAGFTKTLGALLEETFEKVDGLYLDGGTSFFESLDGLSAEAASRPITAAGTSIVGQVRHVRFYLHVLGDYMDGQWHEKVDWKSSWQPPTASEIEWDGLRDGLKDDYRVLRTRFERTEDWNDERRLGGALAIVVHTAYHLGAIRQILRVVKP